MINTCISVCPLSEFTYFVQVVEDGYEFFAKRQLVTLFSAPNYCGDYDNAGGMMTVDEQLFCSFQVSVSLSFHFCLCPFSVTSDLGFLDSGLICNFSKFEGLQSISPLSIPPP